MLINITDDLVRLHAAGILERLLIDKTTGRNILWATDAYAELGPRYERNERIKTGKFPTSDLERIAEALGAKYVSYFEFPDGTQV